MRPQEHQSCRNHQRSVDVPPAIALPLPRGAAWLLRKSLCWKRNGLRDGLSRAAKRAKDCVSANGTAASAAVHKRVGSITLNHNNQSVIGSTEPLPLMNADDTDQK